MKLTTLKDFRDNLESLFIQAILRDNKYNEVRTALQLGISRGTLRTKIRVYGLRKEKLK